MEFIKFDFLIAIFSAKDFIRGMLTTDPAHRLTASELLDHPWVTVCISVYPLSAVFLLAHLV